MQRFCHHFKPSVNTGVFSNGDLQQAAVTVKQTPQRVQCHEQGSTAEHMTDC